MKLITLNIWGARVREPFLDFIRKNQNIDMFCFQELYDKSVSKLSDDEKEGKSPNINSELKELLPEHRSFFRPILKGEYGIGVFIKKEIDVLGEGEIMIHTNTKHPIDTGHHDRNMQWLQFTKKGKVYSVLNVHGLWNGAGKSDTPDRLAQAKRIRDFMKTINTPVILCGDFNLRPDTESVGILEKGMNNLVKSHGVKTTRTSFYNKPEKFADYIFTSPEIAINRFEVMPDEVSDHAPLMLDFD
jgi:endonuclease/exonuclease/phosphatase family metal-dependent hydrolase